MTQEDKNLLLKDLAARVPYGVMVEQTLYPSTIADKEQRLKNVQANYCVQLYWYKYIDEFVPIHCIKPYLRSIKDMTFAEKAYYFAINEEPITCMDWLNKNHFDYRGLIEKGLALEAPEDMYKTV